MTKNKKESTFWTTTFRKFDRFAKPVSLNYMGNTKYKSNCGACVSLVYAIILIAVLIKQLFKIQKGNLAGINYMIKNGIYGKVG
jgi:hypothetical protein